VVRQDAHYCITMQRVKRYFADLAGQLQHCLP
jgi:hypothetical protein